MCSYFFAPACDIAGKSKVAPSRLKSDTEYEKEVKARSSCGEVVSACLQSADILPTEGLSPTGFGPFRSRPASDARCSTLLLPDAYEREVLIRWPQNKETTHALRQLKRLMKIRIKSGELPSYLTLRFLAENPHVLRERRFTTRLLNAFKTSPR